ncbi:MAG: cyclase family protein [Candidatus Velthaea sp.]
MRWTHRPAGSTWGDYGADDQLGRVNLLTPEKVKEGVAEVQHGLTFCLSLPLDYPGSNVLNPRRHPPVLRPTLRNAQSNFNYRMDRDDPDDTDVLCDDAVILHLQYSTQWDSLAHVGQLFDADGDGTPEPRYYNGYRPDEDIIGPRDASGAGAVGEVTAQSTSSANRLGIENLAVKGMQGRAVMIDLHAHFGRERRLVGYDDMMRVLEADRVAIEAGDMICLHTGFAQMLLEMNKAPDARVLDESCAVLDGRDTKLLNWISESNISALIADNYAVEALPARELDGCGPSLPLHAHCLFKLGVPLGEIWHLTPLAQWLREHRRSRFLLTAPPLRLPGAVGSPATPIATV